MSVLPANISPTTPAAPTAPATPAPGPTPYRFIETARSIEAEVGRVIVGQSEVVRGVLTCLLAGGHALLEGIPGLGKTLLVRTIGETLDLTFSRVQFTPDLMPADITGTSILRDTAEGARTLEFQPGPLFANLVLADEVNRATPKTQSALLEAMQERRATAGRTTHTLPEPFFVLATQNPIEMEGTYPLPEAQLDRFLFKLTVPYPTEEDLLRIAQVTTGANMPHPTHVASGAALLEGRYNVAFEDIRAVALPALRHRVILGFEADAESITTDKLIHDVVSTTPA